MSSNKHHELAKQVINQVSDLLTDYPVRQTNSFVNPSGAFPKLIKFDYLGKYSLKGPTRLIIEAGLELAADYTYFNTGYTWIPTKKKYYISNFGCYRNNLVPNTDNESFFSKTYELTIGTNGQIDVELIRHELTHYFLPYLEKLNDVDDLLTFLHWHKPDREEMVYPYRHHSFFYNWIVVIYLLLTGNRMVEAEACIEKISWVLHSLDKSEPHSQHGEATFAVLDKLQKDFVLSRSYRYDERLKRIVAY